MESPKAAVSMLDRYSNDVNDRVVQSVVWHSFGEDPSLAASQIARISDENQRNQMYRRAIGNWLERDPTSAQAWLQKNPLPEAVQNELTRRQTGQP
jgi:exoribonuclease II